MQFKTISDLETRDLGFLIGRALKGGEVIAMTGDLGAGKTTITKSIAAGLDIGDYITSPTFTIVNEYEGRLKLYHFDVYRISDIEEMYDLGYEEYFDSDGVSVIEWANLIEQILPKDKISIDIKNLDEWSRMIVISGEGAGFENLEKELKK